MSANLQAVTAHDRPLDSQDAEAFVGRLTETVLTSLDDAKAEEVVDIDLAGRSALADRMIVASGRSHRHVGAVSDRLLRDLKDNGFGSPKVEGLPANDWVLIDVGDVIVHIFRPEVRDFYNLEKMWSAPETASQGASAATAD